VQNFKIEYFEREHGIGSFPQLRRLKNEEAGNIETFLKRRIGLPIQSSASDLLNFLDKKAVAVEGVDATHDAFDLKSILDKLGFSSEGCFVLFANWHQFQEVEELASDDVCRYFSDIYYPSADDMVIVGSNLLWLMVITHEGEVKALELAGGRGLTAAK
jgi:hypothetical protein